MLRAQLALGRLAAHRDPGLSLGRNGCGWRGAGRTQPPRLRPWLSSPHLQPILRAPVTRPARESPGA